MALVTGDYRVTLFSQIKFTIDASNVFYYKEAGGGTNAIGLADQFRLVIAPAIAGVVSSDTVFNRIYVQELGSGVEIADIPISVVGTRGGASLPTWDGWYFRYFRPNADVGNGRKTFSVPAETDVSDGLPIAAMLTLLNNLAITLVTPLAVPPFYSFLPCIAKTHLITNPTPPPALRRVPETLYPLDNIGFVKLSHQTSRDD